MRNADERSSAMLHFDTEKHPQNPDAAIRCDRQDCTKHEHVTEMGDEAHVEGAGEAEQLGPDIAHANRAQGPAHESNAVVHGLLGPDFRSAARDAVLNEELAGKREDESQDRQRNRSPDPVRRDNCRDVVGAARGQVHVVVAGAETRRQRRAAIGSKAVGARAWRQKNQRQPFGVRLHAQQSDLDLQDPDGLKHAAEQARDMGFSGKGAVHPGQIAPLNEVFTPSAEHVARTRRIIAEFRTADAGLVVIDGKLIKKPVLREMRRNVAIADRIHGH